MSDRHFIPARLRAVTDGDTPEGKLRGHATTYGEAYKVGRGTETIQRGAFDADLSDKGGVVPVFWGHGWAKESNEAPIGYARIDGTGTRMEVDAELFIDTDPKAMSVWRASEVGAIREWSVGFKPTDIGHGRTRSDEVIRQGELLEVSVVLKGQAAGLTGMAEVREDDADDADDADYAGSDDESDEQTEDESSDEGSSEEDSDEESEESEDSDGEAQVDPDIAKRALAHPDLRRLLKSVVVY